MIIQIIQRIVDNHREKRSSELLMKIQRMNECCVFYGLISDKLHVKWIMDLTNVMTEYGEYRMNNMKVQWIVNRVYVSNKRMVMEQIESGFRQIGQYCNKRRVAMIYIRSIIQIVYQKQVNSVLYLFQSIKYQIGVERERR